MTTKSPKGTIGRAPISAVATVPGAMGPVAVGPVAIEQTLRCRSAGFALVRECLQLQDAVRPRSILERFFGADPIVPRARGAYRGALGEVAVAATLTEMGSGWFVVHEVPIGVVGAPVPHLLIGPPGVFTIALHNHAGREVWVRSQGFTAGFENHTHIRDAEFAADRASTLLSEAVGFQVNAIPCVVVLDSRSLTIAKPPRRVAVLTPRQLPGWLAQLPPVLSAHEAALLGMYAEERSTWNEQPCEQEDVRQYVHRFRELQDAVGTATRRRVLWTTGGIVIAWSAFIASLGGAAVGLMSLLVPH
ncbi:nuclease-related domain-containing protein [Parafrigoribacterium mesophilum]|uniref:nuclease-related domain-containing protein n=1 Tax=Parafrigoribacterium mesophilum TaxID=433646 RepID=UPI0031FD9BC5